MDAELRFEPIADHPPGILFDLLCRAYTACAEAEPELVRPWQDDWRAFDAYVFENPDTAGRCGFVSTVEGTAVGFATWDPRTRPVVRIGHHCIAPEACGHGYGKAQLFEMLRRLREDGFERAEATTGAHAFFSPAVHTYLACGFHETGRGALHNGFPTLHYAISLATTSAS